MLQEWSSRQVRPSSQDSVTYPQNLHHYEHLHCLLLVGQRLRTGSTLNCRCRLLRQVPPVTALKVLPSRAAVVLCSSTSLQVARPGGGSSALDRK